MKRIIRDRKLTPEEAAKYEDVREKIKQELPELIARHHQRKKLIQIPLAHNFSIHSTFGNVAHCEKLGHEEYANLRRMPPESYPTAQLAIKRIFALFTEIAHKTLPQQFPDKAKAFKVVVQTLDMVLGPVRGLPKTKKSLTQKQILKELQKHPSVPIVGTIYLYGSEQGAIYTTLQDQQGIQNFIQSRCHPDGQELKQIAQSLNATIGTGTGIYVE